MDVTIRPYRDIDEQAVIDLWLECGLVVPWNDPRRDIRRKMRVQPELFLVALADCRVVATAMSGYDGHRGSVNYLAVAPDLQGRGLGRRMMVDVEERLRRLGCPKINLNVRTSNVSVIEFYEQLGYAVDDVACVSKRLVSDLDPSDQGPAPTQ